MFRNEFILLFRMELENCSDGDSDTNLTPLIHSESDSGLSIDLSPSKPPAKPTNTYLEVAYSLLQIFLSSTLSGVGLVVAGLLLDVVQHWEVFLKVDELFILVPPLLGLKGNLEMTLAARLSTAANLGEVSSLREYLKVVLYNLSLIQGQATIVSLLASCLAVILGLIVSLGQIDWSLVSLIFASALLAACVSGLLLGIIMAVTVYLCATFKLNPDNLASPLAAAMGDIVTLGVLSLVASWLYHNREVTTWMAPIIVALMLPLGLMWLWVSMKSDSTREVVKYGWTPLLIAACISSLGGTVLDKVVRGLEGIAVYSPVINGTGGNLAAIQACRIATSLHSRGIPGCQVTDKEARYEGILHTFWGHNTNTQTARWLIIVSLVGSCIFLLIIHGLNAGHTSLSPVFIISYLVSSGIQVAVLMVLANWIVHLLWFWGSDPNNAAIPYLTALGDLLGTGILSLAFVILWYIGDRDQDVAE